MFDRYYIYDIDPIAFSNVTWYLLNYLVGTVLVSVFIIMLNRKNKFLTRGNLIFYLLLTIPAYLIGARLTYVLVYGLSYFKEHPREILLFWRGGMSFHGALLGIYAISFVSAKLSKHNIYHVTDLISTVAPIFIGLGRLTNFINGELVGRITDVPWAVIFPKYFHVPRHPSQLYEALLEGFILFIIMFINKKNISKPGHQTILFMILYGGMRFFVEFFRRPDPQLGYFFRYFTMGQLLCVLMIIGGAYALVRKKCSHLKDISVK